METSAVVMTMNLINQLIAAECGDRAEDDAHDQCQRRSDHAEFCRDLKAVRNDVGDLSAALLDGRTEVKLRHNILQIRKILLHQRLVKAVLRLQLRGDGSRRCLLGHERTARNGVHDEKSRSNNDPDRQNCKSEAF